MVREMITVQVGQCGNQLGRLFWEQVLAEHAQHNSEGVFDEAMSSFFRNVDTRYEDPVELPLGDGTDLISGLKARAVLVDTEDGVVGETLRGPLADLFEPRQIITDVSGAGNNWAHGHLEYGPRHAEAVCEATRRASELCDSLQCFFLMHSLGGGTGSGLGTYILGLLEDEFPGVFRFTTSVFPSEDDDVITSPYNSVLSLHELIKHADCVLPLENQQLAAIAARVATKRERSAAQQALGGSRGGASVRGGAFRTGRATGRQWLRTPGVSLAARQRSSGAAVLEGDRRGSAAPLFPNLEQGEKGRRERGVARGGGAEAGREQPTNHGGENSAAAAAAAAAGQQRGKSKKMEGFDGMNRVGARLLCHLTSSMRFPGQLNTDLNEITTNLVPYPDLHFLVPSLAPDDGGINPADGSGMGSGGGGGGGAKPPRAAVVRQLFNDAYAPQSQLLASCEDLRRGVYLASAVLLRGEDLSVSDVNACMVKLQPTLNMAHWNREGFKVGLCSAAALDHPHSVLGLANNTCIAATFETMHARFSKLFARRAMVHHYAQYMGYGDAGGGLGGQATQGLFGEAEEALLNLATRYRDLETAPPPSDSDLTRLVPAF